LKIIGLAVAQCWSVCLGSSSIRAALSQRLT